MVGQLFQLLDAFMDGGVTATYFYGELAPR